MPWLDFFRGMAALVVVAYHFHSGLHLPAFSFGYLAVDLFFVLSGIVLGMRYTAAIENGMPFAEFAWHRLRRLYPMAAIAAASIATMNAVGVPVGQYMHAWREGVWSVLFITPYPSSLGMASSFPCDSPMWSLWAELASNIVWFVALRLGRRVTVATLVLSMLAFCVLAIHGHEFFMGLESGARNQLKALIRALAWFGVGYWIALRKPGPIAHPGWIILALVLSCALFETHIVSDVVSGALVVLSGTALLVALMEPKPQTRLVQRICTGLGMLSFPLYLIHVPAGRLAWYPIHWGMNVVLAHVLVLSASGLAAMFLNEAIVERLPTRLRRLAPKAA
jgi:peptidoglycan/LPS O-acetylase OafA/YrhL